MTRDPIDTFIEQMGQMLQAEGAPRIAGHVLGYLLIEGEPRTLSQMTEALKISKASASTNARLLETRGLLRRLSPMGSRQDSYEVVADPNRQMLRTLATRFRANAETISAISATFPKEHCDAVQRVNDFAAFYRQSASFLDEWFNRTGTETQLGLVADQRNE